MPKDHTGQWPETPPKDRVVEGSVRWLKAELDKVRKQNVLMFDVVEAARETTLTRQHYHSMCGGDFPLCAVCSALKAYDKTTEKDG